MYNRTRWAKNKHNKKTLFRQQVSLQVFLKNNLILGVI